MMRTILALLSVCLLATCAIALTEPGRDGLPRTLLAQPTLPDWLLPGSAQPKNGVSSQTNNREVRREVNRVVDTEPTGTSRPQVTSTQPKAETGGLRAVGNKAGLDFTNLFSDNSLVKKRQTGANKPADSSITPENSGTITPGGPGSKDTTGNASTSPETGTDTVTEDATLKKAAQMLTAQTTPGCPQGSKLGEGNSCVPDDSFSENPTQESCTGDLAEIAGGGCNCKTRFQRKNGRGPCVPDENPTQESCNGDHEESSGGVCNCKTGFKRKNVNGPCVPDENTCTGEHEESSGGGCNCKTGFKRKNGNGPCVPDEEPCTGPNEKPTRKDGQCKCKDGYAKSGVVGSCEKVCGINEEKAGSECKCKDGYEKLGSKCVKQERDCPSGQVHHHGKCYTPRPYPNCETDSYNFCKPRTWYCNNDCHPKVIKCKKRSTSVNFVIKFITYEEEEKCDELLDDWYNWVGDDGYCVLTIDETAKCPCCDCWKSEHGIERCPCDVEYDE